MSNEDNIIIIGAGASGIAMGCQLQRQLGFTNFEIYDKGGEMGGTWFFNTYPGAGCDIPSHFYSFSFEPNPDWTQAFALQPEIQQYMINVTKKYNLPAHTHLNTEAISATWDNDTGRWTVDFKDLKANQTYSKTCKFLVMGAGGLSVPNKCPVPGIENFKGNHWHSARWNHDVSLKDKNVIVIGNGCSATQFVPVIVSEVKSLVQFIRSQHWLFGRPDWKYPPGFRWVMRNVPGALKFHRLFWAAFLEYDFGLFKLKSGAGRRKAAAELGTSYMKRKAPEKYHDLLTPKFQVGAKRRVYDTGYYKALHNPKIHLTNDPCVQIKENSVVTKSGAEYPADVIVYANGFQIHEPMVPMVIRGKSEEDVRARWKRQGGCRAYMGAMIADFPNLFTLIGPNTATGHYSIIYTAECTVNMAIRLMRPLLGTGEKGIIEVTEEAEAKDVEWVQEKLKEYVWGSDGESGWYVDKTTGHNDTVYPHYQTHYWLRTLRPVWSDFKITGTKKESSSKIGLTLLAVLVLVFAIVVGVFGK